jgi:arginyl-tRNA synthetase
MHLLEDMNGCLRKVVGELGWDDGKVSFQYSNRSDMGDFQTNIALLKAREMQKSAMELASIVAQQLRKSSLFKSVSADEPGFINVFVNDNVLLQLLNTVQEESSCGYEHHLAPRRVIVDFGGYNIAKEPHVGHLRSTIIGESIRRVYEFCGDFVVSDVHLGDWGLNMGMTIGGIKSKYPQLECFTEGFSGDTIDDLELTPAALTDIYRWASSRSKEDTAFEIEVHRITKLLQNDYAPYKTLWKYFTNLSLSDLKELAQDIFNAHFDLWNGESSVHLLMQHLLRNLALQGSLKISAGAKVIDLDGEEESLPPVIMEKSDGALTYATSDIATILDRLQKFNPDLMLYFTDNRQILHFKQVFLACRKIGLLQEKHQVEHCFFGTVNGKDGKPFKTRSGVLVRLRDLVLEAENAIRRKSSTISNEDVRSIAIACIKFADLINPRESDYVFDFDSFTAYEGKTGAYMLYGLVRMRSLLEENKLTHYAMTKILREEERTILVELTRFQYVVEQAYTHKAPHFIADFSYRLVKKFGSFYANCNINGENDEEYRRSKISLVYILKQYLEKCLYLLGIGSVTRM